MGIMNSRNVMMSLIEEEARSFLSLVSLAQENSIFTEAELENLMIGKLIDIVNYLDKVGYSQGILEQVRLNFDLNSIIVVDIFQKRIISKSGNPNMISEGIYNRIENIFFEYYTFRGEKYIRFFYRIDNKIFQIELSAEKIKRFSQEYGISKILNQISLNPVVKYLVLQDQRGIIFATPGVKTIGKIERDSLLIRVMGGEKETMRIIKFENKNILELVQPFIVEGNIFGIFRLGVSLDNYYRHIKEAQTILAELFIILFFAGFFFLYFFTKYQNYLNLKELFAKTLSSIDEGVILVDCNSKITGVNSMFCSMHNLEEKLLLGKYYNEVFKSDPFEINLVLQKLVRIEDEKKLFGKDIQYATYPLYDQRKKISGAISILRDLTRIRLFEKEREEKERLSFLGNLVANFAHEVKNPLNGLAIAAQRLTKEFPSENEDYQRLTNTLIIEIDSLNKVLNDFLSLVRPQLKEKKVFNLTQVVQDVTNLVKEQAKEKVFTIKEDIALDVNYIGYAEDIKRAVLNILLNAAEAVSSMSGQGKIDVQLKLKRENIVLKISDNGPGINREELTKIFEPYFTTKKGGTGLGLYIAQKIIKEHQGNITVKSALQKGTTLTVTFPVIS